MYTGLTVLLSMEPGFLQGTQSDTDLFGKSVSRLSSKKNLTLLRGYDCKTSFQTKILDPSSVGCLGIAVNKSFNTKGASAVN